MNKLQWKLDTIIGPLYLVANDSGLEGVYWKKQDVEMTKSLNGKAGALKILAQAKLEIEEYLSGKRKMFKVPLNPSGTEFQKKVWQELAKIPYGSTFSYKDIAKKINQEKACRAVGTANGKNPLSLIIPCHRVIASDGTLGGYAGGLKIKTILLDLEKSSGLS